jgi:hypothetical protein
VARVRSPGFRPVRLTRRFSDDTGVSHVLEVHSVEQRTRISKVVLLTGEDQQPAPPPPGPKDIQLSQTHPDVSDVLDILGKDSPSLDFFDLYRSWRLCATMEASHEKAK